MTAPRPVPTRDQLYDAVPGDLLVRQLSVRWADWLPAYALGGAVGLFHAWDDDPDLVVVGNPEDAYDLARHFRAELPERTGHLSLPRAAGERLAAEEGLPVREGWAFRWTAAAPQVPEDTAAWLAEDEHDEVRRLLDDSFPDASMPVGHPAVRRWAGLRRDGRLVAVAADTTGAEGLGFLASIASHPDVRGTGAGAAVTAWATARLVEQHGRCGLWHMGGNVVAAGLYTRLGYADDHQMASIGWVDAYVPPAEHGPLPDSTVSPVESVTENASE